MAIFIGVARAVLPIGMTCTGSKVARTDGAIRGMAADHQRWCFSRDEYVRSVRGIDCRQCRMGAGRYGLFPD
jgi:hypothetical protein